MSEARILVSIGCPSGIGPEVSVLAAAQVKGARVLLVGDYGALRVAARGRGLDPSRLTVVDEPAQAWRLPRRRIAVWQPTAALSAADRRPAAPTRVSGAAQLAWIDAACDRVMAGEGDALVTGPVGKETIVRSGAPGAQGFLGHTEYLQRRLRAPEVVMAFWSASLVVGLATTHLPLARVSRALSPAVVARGAYWLASLLARLAPGSAPRVAVAALNPHAGEGGLLGHEERSIIAPGIARARARLRRSRLRATVDGPVPAESAFRLALARRWEGVLAMYHDQATIPMKIAAFGETVNVSLGLPLVRTSVDHGTAYDLAGRWQADARGMRAALELADRLAASSTRGSGARVQGEPDA